jgi:hypothetical protein
MFGDGTRHPVTTSSLEMDIFARKLGPNMPLSIKLGYKDMKVKFQRSVGALSYNIKLNFILKLSVFFDFKNFPEMKNMHEKELLYDEVQFELSLLTYNLQDTTYTTLLDWQMPSSKFGRKHYPHRNTLNMSSSDYFSFLSQFINELNKNKPIMNHRLKEGVRYPYSVPEFNTNT